MDSNETNADAQKFRSVCLDDRYPAHKADEHLVGPNVALITNLLGGRNLCITPSCFLLDL